jgi:hypothetical protein
VYSILEDGLSGFEIGTAVLVSAPASLRLVGFSKVTFDCS